LNMSLKTEIKNEINLIKRTLNGFEIGSPKRNYLEGKMAALEWVLKTMEEKENAPHGRNHPFKGPVSEAP